MKNYISRLLITIDELIGELEPELVAEPVGQLGQLAGQLAGPVGRLGQHLWRRPWQHPGIEMMQHEQLEKPWRQLDESWKELYACAWKLCERHSLRAYCYEGNDFYEGNENDELYDDEKGNDYDELNELKKYSRILPKTVKKQTNVGQKYKEYIYIWKKSTDIK